MTTFHVMADNTPGILFRVATVFLRRGINIETMTVVSGFFKITAAVDAPKARLLAAQLSKIIGVHSIETNTD